MLKEWKTLSVKNLLTNKIFTVKEEIVESPKKRTSHPVWSLEVSEWVNIIPITSDNKVVLVNQYRFGSKKMSLEIPGGMVDPGEDPKIASVRELYEETGYESKEVIKLGKVLPNPALMGNYAHTFLALNAQRTGLQKLDGMEDIEIVEIPIDDIPKLIESGKIEHSIVISAFYLLERFNKN